MYYEFFIYDNFLHCSCPTFQHHSKYKVRSLYIFSAIGSIVGSLAVDPTQFLIIPSLVGSAIFTLIVLCTVKI